jgi:hypothetical protein
VISKPIKNDESNYGINLKKSSNKVPIIIFRCYVMGDKPIIIEQFMGSRGLLWEVKLSWVRIMGVTLV